jgi:asparagine synthase (glutamine-hydrolysing)
VKWKKQHDMSGIYFVQKSNIDNLQKIAELISSQLSYGGEVVNHYAISKHAVFGMVSPDKYARGCMPRYLKQGSRWGVFSGILYKNDFVNRLFQQYPQVNDDLDLINHLCLNKKLEDVLPNLNGAFFFIIWDPNTKTFIAANDRYGLYPMYWSYSPNGFCIASRVLASVLADTVKGEWDINGVAQLLTLDDHLSDTTLISGVHAFPQASLLYKSESGLKWHSYWGYNYSSATNKINKFELAEELGNRFIKAIKLQTDRSKKVGITLSGGLDSRTIVAASNEAKVPVHTFTWGKRDSYDRQFAGEISRLFNTVHHECDYAFQNLESRFETGIRATEGHINYFDCHMLAHLEVMQDNSDIILNGFAGDLVLGGSYLRPAWMKSMQANELAEKIFRWHNVTIQEDELDLAIPHFSDLEIEMRPSMLYQRLVARMEGMNTPDIVDRFYLENRVRRQCSMGTILMRYAVESAAPFFDYDLIDLITSIPPTLRYEHKIYLLMMKRKFDNALDIRWQRTLLPASAPKWLNVSAKGFLKSCRVLERISGWPKIASRQSPVDFGTCLRGPMLEWLRTMVYDPHTNSESILKSEFCKQVYHRHLDGENMTRLIGAILSIRGFADCLEKAKKKAVMSFKSPVEIKCDHG